MGGFGLGLGGVWVGLGWVWGVVWVGFGLGLGGVGVGVGWGLGGVWVGFGVWVQNTFNEIVLSTDFVEHSSSFDLPAAFLACSEGRLGAARSQKLVIYHAFEQVHCRFI